METGGKTTLSSLKKAVRRASFGLSLFPAAASAATNGYVAFDSRDGNFDLAAKGSASPIFVDSDDYRGVVRAAGDLAEDIFKVTSTRPNILGAIPNHIPEVVIVGALGHSKPIDNLVERRKLDVSSIRGKWESTLIQVVAKPWPGVDRALIVAGSDKRGAIYGIYDLSAKIGVSPWAWWADVPVVRHDTLSIRRGRYVLGEPAVKYRGIFLNDEAPALTGWANEKFGGYNHRFYAHVFELLLRLKANYLWPAMWNNCFSEDDPLNPELADEYGIVMGTSHVEPMMRADKEWNRLGYTAEDWNYLTHSKELEKFWTDGIERNKKFENVVTIAMRGKIDTPMTEEANIGLLERIVAAQRHILYREGLGHTPQLWALYKEVQEYYEKGMRVPDDVTLLWCDDNWGNIRRLPTELERKRSGGAGIYYHFDYVGGPRNYKWLNTNSIPKIREQMHLAYTHEANRIWIVNVGDLKPMELPISFFLDYAWNPESWPATKLNTYVHEWAAQQFGPGHASQIAAILEKYTRFNSRRKPELLSPLTYSLTEDREAERVVEEYNAIAREAQALYKKVPHDQRDAFFQLVLYPTQACAILNELYIAAGMNQLYAAQGRISANDCAERVRQLFQADADLSKSYNKDLANGKWDHMMDQTHIGYATWQEPPVNAMPPLAEVKPVSGESLGLAVEGSSASWPGGNAEPILPPLSTDDRRPHYFEVFDRGDRPVTFKLRGSTPWLRLKREKFGRDTRVWVSADWDSAERPASAYVKVSGSDGSLVRIAVPIEGLPKNQRRTSKGFVESKGCVSIEAEHYDRAVSPANVSLLKLPGYGRTLSAVTACPSRGAPDAVDMSGARLEYRIVLLKGGPVQVHAYLAPTQPFRPGPGFRCAISIDEQAPKIVDMHMGYVYMQSSWEKSVADEIRILTTEHEVGPGEHTLKFWFLDPYLVLEKLVVQTGHLGETYLGPPESVRLR